MTASQKDVVIITAGPGPTELWDAGKYAFSNRFTVDFSGRRQKGNAVIDVRLTMQIVGITHEDGSNQSFIVMANILEPEGEPAYRGTKTFYYNSRRRTGHLDLASA